MGVVYLAEERGLGRQVAIKVLSDELADDDGLRTRFLRESRLAASINHPNILPVFHAGEASGCSYLVMPLVDGADLRTVLQEAGRLEPERAVRLVEQVASALDAAHERGLVHRDVKPANVLVERPGSGAERCYLSDFGLARRSAPETRLTASGQLVGTLPYIAP